MQLFFQWKNDLVNSTAIHIHLTKKNVNLTLCVQNTTSKVYIRHANFHSTCQCRINTTCKFSLYLPRCLKKRELYCREIGFQENGFLILPMSYISDIKKKYKLTLRHKRVNKNFAPNEFYLKWQISCDYCLLYTSPSPRDGLLSRMPSSA